jgi:hypothetical protein
VLQEIDIALVEVKKREKHESIRFIQQEICDHRVVQLYASISKNMLLFTVYN